MSLKYWKINGQSFAFDNQDAEYMKRYEDAFDRMSEEARTLPKDGKASDRIIAYCQVFKNLFDRIFGEGAAEKIYKGVPANVERYNEIYENFLDFVQECNNEGAKKYANLISKYKPNRQQRRSNAKKKK
ncbi:MAG: hypothetical protein IKG98_11660 [Ruminococcus sp.]|nr:hypothetical protein [Ruminococcus sp.]